MQRGRFARSIVAALVGTTGLSACSNTAIIHYRQNVNCRSIQVTSATEPSQTSYSGPDAYFSAFRITKIENNAKNAVPFAFDPKKLFVNETVGGETVAGTVGNKTIDVTSATPTTIGAGQTRTNLGRVVVTVPTDIPVATPITETSDLLYKSSGKESVLLSRDPGPAPTFVEQCTLSTLG